MSETPACSGNNGCGCFGLIVTILVLWALWFGLPTSWGVFHIDIFPPAVWVK